MSRHQRGIFIGFVYQLITGRSRYWSRVERRRIAVALGKPHEINQFCIWLDEIADRSAINRMIYAASGSQCRLQLSLLLGCVALLYFNVGFNYDVIYYIKRVAIDGSKGCTIVQRTHLSRLKNFFEKLNNEKRLHMHRNLPIPPFSCIRTAFCNLFGRRL